MIEKKEKNEGVDTCILQQIGKFCHDFTEKHTNFDF